jgi:hypothetical protein
LVLSKNKTPLEGKEQEALVLRLREKKIPFYAVPNGADVEPHHRALMKREGMENGVSDLVILKFKDALYLEMKRRKGGVWGPDQKAFKEKIEALGFRYEVAKGAKEAWEKITEFLSKETIASL